MDTPAPIPEVPAVVTASGGGDTESGLEQILRSFLSGKQ